MNISKEELELFERETVFKMVDDKYRYESKDGNWAVTGDTREKAFDWAYKMFAERQHTNSYQIHDAE